MSRPTPPAPYVPTAYREGTPLAAKIARENAEVRRSMQREAARPKGHPVSADALRGYLSTPDAHHHPEKAVRVRARIAELDAEEAKGKRKGKSKGQGQADEANGARRRQRRPGQAPTLGPWQRVYGIVCPRCQATSGELCHTSAGEFRSAWEPHRGREKHHLGKRSVTDRRVRPIFEQALRAWEDGMSAKAAGITNQLPGDEDRRQAQRAGTRQGQVSQVAVKGKVGRPTGRVQSVSTSSSGGAGVLRGFIGGWITAFRSAYSELGTAYEQGKRR